MNTKCEQCRTLVFREVDHEIPTFRPVQGSQRLVQVLHHTEESWTQSIASGCHFCTLVRGQVYNSVVSSPVCDAFGAFVILAVTFWPGFEHSSTDLRIQIISKLGNSQLSAIDDLPDCYLTALHHHITHSQRQPFAIQHRNRHPNSIWNIGQREKSLFNVQLARLWRDECLRNHATCQRGSNGGEPKLPTRLIDVANPEHPFIHAIQGLPQSNQDIKYVALSYSWGQGKRFLTLRKNYEIFKTVGITSSDLPKTFQDAIHAAHCMGYRYIWIDALCIIQDDPEDNQNEIDHMGDIYRCAELTLCAQGAASSHSGLFQRSRPPLSLVPCSVELRMMNGSQDTAVLNHTLTGSLAVKDYLTSRGWVLQEEILTLRALKFSDQMSWRCMEAIRMETEPHVSRLFPHPRAGIFKESNGRVPHFMDPLQTFRTALYTSERSDAGQTTGTSALTESSLVSHDAFGSGVSLSDIFAAWYSIIQIYSDMDLTFSSDILRALRGLSNMFRQTYRTTYLAGLWREDLFAGLCWYVSVNDTRPVAGSGRNEGSAACTTATRATKGRFSHTAPSWSWASVGKVRVRFACLSTRATYTKCQRKARDETCEILDAFCYWDDPIHQTRPVLPSSISHESVPGQLWSLRLRTKVRKAILRGSESYTHWRIQHRIYTAVTARNPVFESLKTAPGIYPRFPGQLLDFEDRTIALGEVACDSGFKYEMPTIPSLSPDPRHHNQLVKWHPSSSFGETRGKDTYQDLEVMCLLLDAYQFWPDWYDVCLVALPRAKGSTSFIRIGLGFLPRGENDEEGARPGWDEMDCEIF